jgi:hypothetical protein
VPLNNSQPDIMGGMYPFWIIKEDTDAGPHKLRKYGISISYHTLG